MWARQRTGEMVAVHTYTHTRACPTHAHAPVCPGTAPWLRGAAAGPGGSPGARCSSAQAAGPWGAIIGTHKMTASRQEVCQP